MDTLFVIISAICCSFPAIVLAATADEPNVLPEFLHVCHRSDADLPTCLKKSIEFTRPYLARGIPELDIPSIEPMEIGDLIVSEAGTNGIRIVARDIRGFGPSSFEIRKFDVLEPGKAYAFELLFPKLNVDGKYSIDGQLLLLTLKGSGPFYGNFSNVVGTTKLNFELMPDNHLKLNKVDIKIKVGRGSIKLQNLFNGDKALGDAINDTINSNFDVFSREIIPLIEKALARLFKKIGNKVVQQYTFDQLFPE